MDKLIKVLTQIDHSIKEGNLTNLRRILDADELSLSTSQFSTARAAADVVKSILCQVIVLLQPKKEDPKILLVWDDRGDSLKFYLIPDEPRFRNLLTKCNEHYVNNCQDDEILNALNNLQWLLFGYEDLPIEAKVNPEEGKCLEKYLVPKDPATVTSIFYCGFVP